MKRQQGEDREMDGGKEDKCSVFLVKESGFELLRDEEEED